MVAEAVAAEYQEELKPEFQSLPAKGEIERYLYNSNTSMGLDTLRLYNENFGKRQIAFVPRIKLSNGALVTYSECLEKGGAHTVSEASMANLTRGDYNGYLSPATARKCKSMITAWVNSVNCASSSKLKDRVTGQVYLTFATLTLQSAQIHTDQEIRRSILMPFIQCLTRTQGLKHYFWKAEPQGNGNIHFHMLLDSYIDRELLSSTWDYYCEFLGYVTRYCEKTGSLFAPATNICQLPSDSSAISYVVKYLAKAPIKLPSFTVTDGIRAKKCSLWQEKKDRTGAIVYEKIRAIEGRVWGCSDGVRECKPPTLGMSERIELLIKFAEDSPKTRIKSIERATVYICPVPLLIRSFDASLWKLWRWHHLALFRFLYMDRKTPPHGNYYELGRGLQHCSQ
jgi:hypothetical protein